MTAMQEADDGNAKSPRHLLAPAPHPLKWALDELRNNGP